LSNSYKIRSVARDCWQSKQPGMYVYNHDIRQKTGHDEISEK